MRVPILLEVLVKRFRTPSLRGWVAGATKKSTGLLLAKWAPAHVTWSASAGSAAKSFAGYELLFRAIDVNSANTSNRTV